MRLQKLREQERRQYELEKQKVQSASSVNIRDKFAARKLSAEEQLKEETIGLVTLDSFRKKKQEIDLAGAPIKEPERKKRKERVDANKLSFLSDENGEEGEANEDEGNITLFTHLILAIM